MRICEGWLHNAPTSVPTGAQPGSVVIHVDAETLTGVDRDGLCHLDDGPALPATSARRVACDGYVGTVVERNGVPVDIGTTRRVVPPRMRRLVQLRDQVCRYPGCSVPAGATECHHVIHWVDGGRTRVDNLISLCRFHHHRHHEGAFEIVALRGDTGAVHLRFKTFDGTRKSTQVSACTTDHRNTWR